MSLVFARAYDAHTTYWHEVMNLLYQMAFVCRSS